MKTKDLLFVSFLMLGSALAPAQTNFWWTNTVSGANWNTAGFWTNDLGTTTQPASNNSFTILNFFKTATYTTTNNYGSFTLNQLNFSNSTVTIAGNALTFTYDDTFGLPQINQFGASNVTLSVGLVLTTNTTINFNAPVNGQITINRAISGTGQLLVQSVVSNASLILATNNTFTGGTVITGGARVQITNGSGFGTGSVTATNNGQIWINGVTATNALYIAGQGYNDDLGRIGAIRMNTATASGPITLLDNTRIGSDTTGNAGTLSGNISGDYALSFYGYNNAAAVFTVLASNSYTGGTLIEVNAGAVRAGNDNAFGTGPITFLTASVLSSTSGAARVIGNALVFSNNATLGDATHNGALTFTGAADLAGSNRTLTIASTVTISGVITNGALTKAGASLLVLTGTNTYSDTIINAGTLRADLGVGLPAAGNITISNAVLETGATFTNALGTGGGQVQVLGGTAGFSAFGNVATVNFNNDGSTVLWGTNLFNPSIFVLNASSANNNLTFANTLDLNGAMRTVQVNAATAIISGVITDSVGTAGFTKTGGGVLVLANTNSYAGPTVLSAGTLSVATLADTDGPLPTNSLVLFTGGALRYTGSGETTARAFTNGATGVFDISGAGSVLTLSGSISGTGVYTKAGVGTLLLTAASNTFGRLNVTAGTVVNASALTLNYPGNSLTVAGATFTNTGLINITGAGGRLLVQGAGGVFENYGVISNGVGYMILNDSLNSDVATFNNNTGGQIWLAGAQPFSLQRGTSTWNNAGGDLIVAGTQPVYIGGGWQANNFPALGTFNIYSGSVTFASSGNYYLGSYNINSNGTGILNLNGGTLTLNRALLRGTGYGSTGLFYFAGGTLAGVSNNVTLLGTDLTAVQIKNGGAFVSIASNMVNTISAVLGNYGGDSGALTKVGGGSLVLSNNNTYTGDTFVNAGTLQLGVGGTIGSVASANINIATGAIFALSRSDSFTNAYNLSGGGLFVKKGSGALTMLNPNSYSGGTVLTGGALVLGTNNALGTGPLTFSGNVTLSNLPLVTLTLGLAMTNSPGANTTIANSSGAGLTFSASSSLSGTGIVNFTGANTINLQGDGSGFSGIISNLNTFNFSPRPAATSSNAQWANLGVLNAFQTGNQTFHFGSLSGTGSIHNSSVSTNTLRIGALGLTTTYSGTIEQDSPTQDLAVAIVGGKLTLSGTNTYGGGTTLNAGTLSIANTAHLPSGTLTFAGGTLQITGTVISNFTGYTVNWASFNGGLDIAASAVTINNAIGGSGSLTKSGAGTLILTGNNTFTGGVVLAAGTLSIGADASLGAVPLVPTTNFTVTGASTLKFTAATTIPTNRLIQLNAGLTLNLQTNTSTTIAANIGGTGALTLDAAISTNIWLPTLILSGSNTFTGGVTINRGIILINNSDALGTGNKTIVINQGTTGNPQLHLDGSAGSIVLGTNITFQTSNATSGSLHNLAGTNTIMGAITMTAGGGDTVLVSDNGLLIISGKVFPTTTGRNLRLRGDGDGEISGVISNGSTVNMPLYKDGGAGTWTLSGTNTYTGATTVSAGTLRLGATGMISNSPTITVSAGAIFDVSPQPAYTLFPNQTLNGNGTVTGNVAVTVGSAILPSGVGTLTFANDLTLVAGYTNTFDFAPVGASNDTILVGGSLNAGGSVVAVNLLDRNLPMTNGSYQLFAHNGFAGSFGDILGNTTRKVWELTNTASQINLLVSGSYTSLVWSPSASADWDLLGSTNWLNGANPDRFFDLDSVTFDDTGAGTNSVNLVGTLRPGSVTVNSASNYTFSGSGKITGLTSLVKDGSGTLTIATSNDFTGGVTLNAGAIRVAANGALSTAALTVPTNTALELVNSIVLGNTLSLAGTLRNKHRHRPRHTDCPGAHQFRR